MRYSTFLRSGLALIVLACSSSTSEIPLAAGDPAAPTITTDKSVYTRADMDISTGTGIHATLVAAREKAYYARLGDAFNSAIDQNPLYVAEGSDGALERQSGDSWTKVQGGILVEGVREVVVSPTKTYVVLAHASGSIPTGMYRLSITLRETSGGPATLRIVSPSFEVK